MDLPEVTAYSGLPLYYGYAVVWLSSKEKELETGPYWGPEKVNPTSDNGYTNHPPND